MSNYMLSYYIEELIIKLENKNINQKSFVIELRNLIKKYG